MRLCNVVASVRNEAAGYFCRAGSATGSDPADASDGGSAGWTSTTPVVPGVVSRSRSINTRSGFGFSVAGAGVVVVTPPFSFGG